MNVLIAFASRYGSAEKCAKGLKSKLKGNVDIYDLSKTKKIDLTPYDKIIIGGSIYVGKVQKEVKAFCLEHSPELLKKKLGLYICGMLEEQAELELNNSYSEQLRSHATVKDFFGGEFKFKQMKRFERFMVKMVSKLDKNQTEIDISKDISTISDSKINQFAELMNNA